MKCIKNVKTGKITRVSNDIASIAVDSEEFKYISKSTWKSKTRNK